MSVKNPKMKGLLKGLRYISQIFEEEEKEADIQIGFPTDVKHVAHIGWDGPSASSPSWMNDFKSSGSNGDANKEPEDAAKNVSQDKKAAKESSGRDLPSLPKASRRQASIESIGSVASIDESPAGSPTSHKSTKSSRGRRSKHKESTSPKAEDSSGSVPNIPKKSRRKKSKDEDSTRSSRSKEKGSKRGSRHGSEDGSAHFGGESGLSTLREEDHG